MCMLLGRPLPGLSMTFRTIHPRIMRVVGTSEKSARSASHVVHFRCLSSNMTL